MGKIDAKQKSIDRERDGITKHDEGVRFDTPVDKT